MTARLGEAPFDVDAFDVAELAPGSPLFASAVALFRRFDLFDAATAD